MSIDAPRPDVSYAFSWGTQRFQHSGITVKKVSMEEAFERLMRPESHSAYLTILEDMSRCTLTDLRLYGKRDLPKQS